MLWTCLKRDLLGMKVVRKDALTPCEQNGHVDNFIHSEGEIQFI